MIKKNDNGRPAARNDDDIMTRKEMLEKAIDLLATTATPRRIILFGSEARGDADPASDFNFVVILRQFKNRRAEIVRLLEALEPHAIPADIFVASEEFFEAWSDIPGSLLYEDKKEGKIVYDAA